MIHIGDSRDILKSLEPESVDCIVTSPPYYQMRDYGHENQIGAENSWQEYLSALVEVFSLAKDILKEDGTMWINLGDKYSGSHNGMGSIDKKRLLAEDQRLNTHWKSCEIPERNLMGLPWRLAFALQEMGWILRQDIIWHKPNAIPAGGSAPNKCTPAHEYIFLFTKKPTGYYFSTESIKERATGNGEGSIFGGKKYDENTSRKFESNPYHVTGYRCKRDVWSICTQGYSGAHFATFPEEIPKTCILAGCPEGGTVLDPFCGSGTTGKVAYDLGREFIGIELNPDYAKLAEQRVGKHIQTKLGVSAE